MKRILVLVLIALAAAPAAAAATPAQLLARYRPTLVLHPLEAFRPVNVEPFLADAELELLGPGNAYAPVGNVADAPLPTDDPAGCRSTSDLPCWRLDHVPCSPAAGLAAVACAANAEAARGARPTTYARLVATGNRIVLQYWLFYTYNFWSAQLPPTNFIWHAHEADWELVSVVLDRRQRPLLVGTSRHCSGARREWSRVAKDGRTHPRIHVALGSHANYFAPRTHELDRRCYPPQLPPLHAGYGVGMQDFAATGATVRPRVVRVTATSPSWMRFPGSWGEHRQVHYPDPLGTLVFGAGPRGPVPHSTWRRPLATVLAWRRD